MEQKDSKEDAVIQALMCVLNAELTKDLSENSTAVFSYEEVTAAMDTEPPELQIYLRKRIAAVITAVLTAVMGNMGFQIRSIRKIRGEQEQL